MSFLIWWCFLHVHKTIMYDFQANVNICALFQVPNYCFDQGYENEHNEHNQTGSGEVAPQQAILIKYSNIVTSLEHVMQDLLRDAKEKFKNWITCSILEGVDSAYKKVI